LTFLVRTRYPYWPVGSRQARRRSRSRVEIGLSKSFDCRAPGTRTTLTAYGLPIRVFESCAVPIERGLAVSQLRWKVGRRQQLEPAYGRLRRDHKLDSTAWCGWRQRKWRSPTIGRHKYRRKNEWHHTHWRHHDHRGQPRHWRKPKLRRRTIGGRHRKHWRLSYGWQCEHGWQSFVRWHSEFKRLRWNVGCYLWIEHMCAKSILPVWYHLRLRRRNVRVHGWFGEHGWHHSTWHRRQPGNGRNRQQYGFRRRRIRGHLSDQPE